MKFPLPLLRFAAGFEAALALLLLRSGEISISKLAIPSSRFFVFIAGHKALLIEWAIDAISKAEKEFVGTKLGEARLAVVVSWLREKVPAPIRFLVTDDLIRKAVQTSFNAAKSGLEVLKNA